uniref:NAD(P)-dependent dehydrogenase, short-chain alcohol dehydrogenase family n=1 Tax=Candidatus Kentrum sp. FW TaxID=2126338 RepID=A0A450SLS7_9GAMM|nr:MAG: NAD(P)-dependent dehydrogenase, short-chain alcohol dehydrogenase family [Candidatus Kentron sp. FW]VFJ54643.1 MAG: NAD(P)-dependent dehydrogenase, short-chain alcohol dehydrogenase family [Candidatus Kentron sp. FW]
MKNISGQSALISGGGSGMGAETAKALAEAGVKVALLDMNAEAAQKVADEIGKNAIAVQCDVSDGASTEAAVTKAREANGAARILVNCAGIAPPKKVIDKEGNPVGLDFYAKVIGVNLIGIYNVMRLAAADMMKLDPVTEAGERGVVINTASIAAFDGQIGQTAYGSSKAGVVGLTLPTAREFAPSGIRVMCVCPGIIGTPMLLGLPENVQEALAKMIPFPSRLGFPSEFSSLVMHIIDNELLNGEVIRLDGAIRMAPK